MRFARVLVNESCVYGIVRGDEVVVIEGTPFGPYSETDRRFSLGEVKLSAPVEPSKIVCVGLNYADHAAETGKALPDEPCLFMKPATAVIGPGETIIYPAMASRVDHEAELAIVIAKRAKDVPEESWRDYVLGYTCFNDVTARDLQAKDGQWTRAKGFDTFAPVGPWVETDLDCSDLAVSARVNGVTKQESRTSELIFRPGFLVSFISRIMTLLPGDLIATGTPSGISPVEVGDAIEIEVEGIGVLKNTVTAPGEAQ